MEIKIKTDDDSHKGHHQSTVIIWAFKIGNASSLPCLLALEGTFPDARVELDGHYGPEQGVRVVWNKKAKYKKDAPSSAAMLGELTLKYGNLEPVAREVIERALVRVEIHNRAENIAKTANVVGIHLATEAFKKAVEDTGFKEKLAVLHTELEVWAKSCLKDILKDEDWVFEGGEKIPAEVQELVTQNIAEFVEDRMVALRSGGFPRSKMGVFPEDDDSVSFLAILMEGQEQDNANDGDKGPGARGSEANG